MPRSTLPASLLPGSRAAAAVRALPSVSAVNALSGARRCMRSAHASSNAAGVVLPLRSACAACSSVKEHKPAGGLPWPLAAEDDDARRRASGSSCCRRLQVGDSGWHSINDIITFVTPPYLCVCVCVYRTLGR